MSFGKSEHTYPGPGPHVRQSRSNTQVSSGRSAMECSRVLLLTRSARGMFVSLWHRAIVLPATLIARPIFIGAPSRALVRKVEEIVDQHSDALVRIRAELLHDIGTAWPQNSQWDDEVARFINSQIAEAFIPKERAAIERHFEAIQDHVARRVGEIAAHQWVYQ
jgi:hypothetical protein